ncbi:beta-glucoside specific PTS system component [Corynebacterium kutscheri]|uniref:Beta-glucoside specific PTS system component n=1 Tax=Corynebacterium kutscheri TaxID=35755 RepID=A0A0F6R218_9CORY|nr:beta-glucoside-specific PTS transporter subunit IIABC [Corynebacterium kutscheri]AKE42215.1 PTS system beta-glucoside-specific IIC component [Corynebacterium kutscheri]VEH05746.1 beta-glucoside specific PTS system component [Corynebacterium kutscheri]VEH10558.1 beta-glucoside specific PTS system component [Corynebacterium kutscheri]VEH81641.1 beta-glucoside specific PTS system component [Corynebacterium kutscheri]
MSTKTDFEPLARSVITALGGSDNITSVTHCATRLRFKVKDSTAINEAAIKNTAGVLTLVKAGGQHQIVIGNDVPFAYEAIVAQPHMAAKGVKEGGGENTSGEQTVEKKNAFNAFIDLISSIFSPILWCLAGIALLKAFLSMGTTLEWFGTESVTYIVFQAASDGLFYFLPLFLAITAAHKFKMNEFIALAVVAPLVYPSIVALTDATEPLTLLGLPLVAMNYTSSVIPAIVAVWLASYVQRFLEKYLPSAIRNFMTPVLTVTIMVPLVLLTVGPLTMLLAQGISTGVTWLTDVAPWLAGGLMGGFWQVLVIFGLHWGFVPIFLNDIATTGLSPILAPLQAAVLAQAMAVLAVSLRTRNAARKKLAGPASISALVAGVTEPAIYGVNLPLKVPFYAGIAGGVVGGIIIGLADVGFTSFVFPSLLAFPAVLGTGNFTLFVIGTVVAMIIGFVGTWFLLPQAERNFDATTDPAPVETTAAKAEENTAESTAASAITTVIAPVAGTLIPIEDVADKVFASEAMGASVAINPTDGTFLAPITGTIIAAPKTGHAFGIKGDNGIELLIHIGIDTVQMAGKGFTPAVKVGDKVTVGDKLVDVSLTDISEAGYQNTTIIIVTNSKKLTSVDKLGQPGSVISGEPLLRTEK